MIKDYLKVLNKEDLSFFLRDSTLFSHTHDNTDGKTTVYYYTKVEVEDHRYEKGYITFTTPSNMYDISKILLKLGAIKNDIREPYIDEDPCYAIDDINFDKLNLLKEILFHQENRVNSLFLDKLTNKLIKLSIRPITILNTLKININDIVNFNDIEILIHAISIKHPEKLNKITDIINNNKELYNSKNTFQKEIKYVIVKKNGIYDDKQNIIFHFSNIESLIAKEIKSKGMSLESLKKITNQPTTNAVSSSIKTIKAKIKKYNLKDYIIMSYSGKEKTYKLEQIKY